MKKVQNKVFKFKKKKLNENYINNIKNNGRSYWEVKKN